MRRLDPQVAVRSEAFGALLYHFGTRRLSFLKSPAFLSVGRGLSEHPTARQAWTAVGVDTAELVAFERALATLAVSNMIIMPAEE